MKVEKSCPVCRNKFMTPERKQSTTCSRSCSNTFFKEKRYTQASNKKKSASLKGKPSSKPFDTGVWVTKNCSVCKREFTRRRCVMVYQKTCGEQTCKNQVISDANVGHTGGPRTGGGRGHQTEYAGVVWDSTWEVKFAKRLDELSISWVRPMKDMSIPYVTLNGKQRNYYPDFFLPSLCLFVEVKGYWSPEARHKFECAKARVNIIALDSLELILTFTGA